MTRRLDPPGSYADAASLHMSHADELYSGFDGGAAQRCDENHKSPRFR
jgi:hypothetical protein